MNQAVFLDRDGVINPLVYNLLTKEYESPHDPTDFSIYPYVDRALKKIANAGYYLFLVSNQPSYAKGKTTLENIQQIQSLLEIYLSEHEIVFADFYYCYHHPNGVIPAYTCKCQCRKPGTKFIERAEQNYNLDLKSSWFVGDQDTDAQCGKAKNMRSILIRNKHSASKRTENASDYVVKDLEAAAEIICADTDDGAG